MNNAMVEKCDNLYKELTKRTGANPKIHDMLAEYRKWFDEHGIKSEGKDGWPLPFVFEERNILAFVNDWKLCMNPPNQPLQRMYTYFWNKINHADPKKNLRLWYFWWYLMMATIFFQSVIKHWQRKNPKWMLRNNAKWCLLALFWSLWQPRASNQPLERTYDQPC